ncbi:MAG: hypothetical protein KA004_11415 [Verrucomicrobiales bacterium]|nr:hypothetical protein [Verrucomicrobiales bacterium]
MKSRISKHRARVYFRAYLPQELTKAGRMQLDEGIEPSWREAVCMEFVHDSHSSCETVTVTEATEEAVLHALKMRHPHQKILILKINWLQPASLG